MFELRPENTASRTKKRTPVVRCFVCVAVRLCLLREPFSRNNHEVIDLRTLGARGGFVLLRALGLRGNSARLALLPVATKNQPFPYN